MAVFLGAMVFSVLTCAGFNRVAKADGGAVNAPDPGEKQTSYIVEAGQGRVADLTGIAEAGVEPDKPYTEDDVIALAKMAYGEALITRSDTEMSACMWCALNRLDSGYQFYDGCESVYDIVTQRNQFYGYDEGNPVDDHLVWLAQDVLTRWVDEHNGAADVGRTLPKMAWISVHERINAVRKSKGMTSEKLAEACDIGASYLRQIESGAKVPSLPLFIVICQKLQVSPNCLLPDLIVPSESEKLKKIEKIFLEGNPKPKQIEMFEEMAEVILKGR